MPLVLWLQHLVTFQPNLEDRERERERDGCVEFADSWINFPQQGKGVCQCSVRAVQCNALQAPRKHCSSVNIHPKEESVVRQTLGLAELRFTLKRCNKHLIHPAFQGKYGQECSFNQVRLARSLARPVLPRSE